MNKVSWNGHYLIGYCVALSCGFLIGGWSQGGWTVQHNPPCARPALRCAYSTSPSAGPQRAMATMPKMALTTSVAASCDVLREAILTGSKEDIVAGMNAVLADRMAHDTAREFAKYYTDRDSANESRQRKDLPIVQFYCSL